MSPVTAADAGLSTGDGIIVNEFLQTSHPDIYTAGDNARFPYQALGRPVRLEHWDNALIQENHAGRNMAGAREPHTYMPYSDLFEFGYVSGRAPYGRGWFSASVLITPGGCGPADFPSDRPCA